MTTTVPVLSGLAPAMVALDGTAVRAWADSTAHCDSVRPVLAHRDLLELVAATPALRVLFLDDGAVLFGPFGMIEPIAWVHVERVGLKCYDLREAGLPFVLVDAAVVLPAAA